MSVFVDLKSQNLALTSLKDAVTNKAKIILLLGKSGTGKSFLLDTISKKYDFILFKKPFFNEEELSSNIANAVLKQDIKPSFDELYKLLSREKGHFVLIFDEFGMYEDVLLERLRILSELNCLSLVFSTHKKHKLLEKEHFASRISKEIILEQAKKEELKYYLKEKYNAVFNTSCLSFLAKKSLLNLRTVDKLLNTFKELELHYEKARKTKDNKSLLELSALHHGIIKA